MVKLLGGGMLATLAVGAFFLVLNQASSTVGNGPVGRDVQNVATKVPGATIDGLKKTTDAISANPTTNEIASQSDTYRGTKTAVDSSSFIMDALAAAWALLKLAAKVALVLCGIALITRTYYRRRRTYITYEIRTHRESIVST